MADKQINQEQLLNEAKKLKEKGINELNNNNFKEVYKSLNQALINFTESYEIKHDNSTEAYIHKCRKFLNQERLKQEASKTPDIDDTPTNFQSLNSNSNINADKDCQDVIEKKDYYEILGVSKEADEMEIKRAYKKVLIFL